VVALDYVHKSKKQVDQFTKGMSCHMIDCTSSEMGLRST
jgi:hypothetical protein